MTLAQLIKTTRTKRGWSLSDLSHRSGISRPELSRIERAIKSGSSLRVVHGLAVAFSGRSGGTEYAAWLSGIVTAALRVDNTSTGGHDAQRTHSGTTP